MANILSQDEIDALMDAVEDDDASDSSDGDSSEAASHGEGSSDPDKKATSYDFRRPNRSFFREQLRVFESIHEGFARQYGASLAAYLRSMVEIEIVAADQLTYGEYVLSLPNYTSLYLFGITPLEGRAVMEVNPSLTLSIVDRLFGGVGRESEVNRDLTDIETAVMTRLVERALVVLQQAWRGIAELNLSLMAHETKPVMMQLMSNAESVVLISFDLKTQYTKGSLSLCYPYSSIEPLMPRISQTQMFTKKAEQNPREARWMRQQLGASSLDLTAKLGEADLSIGDFLKLRPGDVLSLDQKVQDPIELLVSGEVKAMGRPGLKGRHRCVKVHSVVHEEEMDESGTAA